MSSEEAWVQNVLKVMVRDAVITYLKSREDSSTFLGRIDSKVIESEIAKITNEVTANFVAKLKAKGYLVKGHDAPQEEFMTMFRATLDEYFANLEGN
jgi:hypothetical protein